MYYNAVHIILKQHIKKEFDLSKDKLVPNTKL